MAHGSANPQTRPSPAPTRLSGAKNRGLSLPPRLSCRSAPSVTPRLSRPASAASSLCQKSRPSLPLWCQESRLPHPPINTSSAASSIRTDPTHLPCSQPEPDFCSQLLPPFHNTASAASSNIVDGRACLPWTPHHEPCPARAGFHALAPSPSMEMMRPRCSLSL
jgi:hypothetical protein